MAEAALTDDSVRQVALHLSASDVSACRATCRGWRRLCSEDHLWRRLASSAYFAAAPGGGAPEQPLAPVGGYGGFVVPSSAVAPAPSWRVAYQRWSALSHYVDGGRGTDAALWLRIAAAWALIEAALRERAPVITATLCAPSSPEVLAQVRSRTLRYIYAVHDGQLLPIDRFMLAGDQAGARAHIDSLWHGLFGGFSCYQHHVCMRMHPASVAAGIVAKLGPDLFHVSAPAAQPAARLRCAAADAAGTVQLELLSSSYNFNRIFAADEAGGLFCLLSGGEWEAVAPSACAWFCEYGRRLSCGFYRVGQIYAGQPSEGVVLFQDEVDGEWCTRCVTNGVEVVASALYTPELPQAFSYSLRMRMGADAPHASAQLHRRIWSIEDGSGEPPRLVSGEGVVGQFPVLRAGGGYRADEQTGNLGGPRPFEAVVPPGAEQPGWFVYQSFSGPMHSAEGGRFGGEIEFVPGTVAAPTGAPFKAAVLPFRLRKPEFVY